eukprot:m51a1_g1378 hypothetical protein (309) ;mRNA; f:445535-446589
MEPLHSRVVPTAQHTLDDLVFAAFQGPVLSLSARVLFRHRRRLSKAEVGNALLHARCCAPDTLATVHCRTCGGVLDVLKNCEEAESLRRGLPQEIELYAVVLRTLCTSSRKHVGSAMLALAVDLAGVAVVSDRFAIYARHAARHMPRDGGSEEKENTERRLVPVESHSRRVTSPSSCLEECFVIGTVANSPPLVPGRDLAPLGPLGPQGMVVGVCINAVPGLTEEENQLMISGAVPLLRANVPGYLVHKTSVHASVVITVLGALSPDDLLKAQCIAERFIQNGIRNPLNRNLIGDGLLQRLLISTNMS